MARKHKRPSIKARAPARAVTAESARDDLQAGRFREAIAGFKALLREDPRDVLREGLADAYEGRARQLAGKGMLKEALVMWENRAALGEMPRRLDHAALLLRLGRVGPVLEMLGEPSVAGDPALGAGLASHLAAQLLGGTPGIAEALPADHPVRVQGAAAEEALGAYCAGNDQALAQALRAIPFRSPYRDLVQILRALSRLDPAARDPASGGADEVRGEAAGLLDRVGDDSGFAHLRDAARLSLLPEAELAPRLREAGPAGRDLVFALRGWSVERAALWNELPGPGERPRELLCLMFRHRRALGEDWARERGLRLLLPNLGAGARWWLEAGGKPLTDLEIARLNAWQSEAEGNPWRVAYAWQDYANLLSGAGQRHPPTGSDAALRIALARRRTDHLFEVMQGSTPDADPESLPAMVAADLEASLETDPDDRPTYLSLIGYYLRANALKDARRILKLAQARWPTEKAVLTAAMDIALAGGAFKKAASIARDVLAVDPINSPVRERLVDAHLAHARKNLRDRRPDLAERALNQAEEWVRGEVTRERLALMRALVGTHAGAPEGEERLHALADRLGRGLAARLALLLEADGCGVPGRPLLERLDLAKPPAPDVADLRAFFTRLRAHLDAGAKLPPQIGRELGEPLKRAARLKLDRGELESICETLRRAGLHAPRLAFANAALKRWRGEPVFELHTFEARHDGVAPWAVGMPDLLRLEKALERARAAGDSRLVHRLIELLNGLAGPFGPSPRGPLRGGFSDPIRERGTEGADPAILEQFADLIRTLGPGGVQDLLREPGPLGDALRGLERAIGKRTLREMVDAILAGHAVDDRTLPDRGRIGPKPTPPRSRRRETQDDDADRQLDLFK